VRRSVRVALAAAAAGIASLVLPVTWAAVQPAPAGATFDLGGPLGGPAELSQALKIVVVFTALSLLPTILLMCTSFVRLVIVFHFLRQALGTQTTPPNQVLLGLSLFLTLFVMYPTGQRVYADALQPYQEGRIDFREAMKTAVVAPREWMVRNTREKDLMLFVSLSRIERP
jgi:flagellar biosynthesis protein FliP